MCNEPPQIRVFVAQLVQFMDLGSSMIGKALFPSEKRRFGNAEPMGDLSERYAGFGLPKRNGDFFVGIA